jgi:chaperonin GroEL (HSP60 family)
VVIGGGATLYHASQALSKAGYSGDVFELFQNGLLTPITTIISNSGAENKRYSLGKENYMCGKTGEMRKAKEDGVYDPTQVVLNSLESAVSIAALLLMTDAAIIAPTT